VDDLCVSKNKGHWRIVEYSKGPKIWYIVEYLTKRWWRRKERWVTLTHKAVDGDVWACEAVFFTAKDAMRAAVKQLSEITHRVLPEDSQWEQDYQRALKEFTHD